MSRLRIRIMEQRTNLRHVPNSRFIDAWDKEWNLKPIEIKEK